MSNLTTRKIVLGLLMTLVLTFSVLGTADAIDRLTRNSGDLQTVTAGREYKIQFTVRLQSTTTIPAGATGTYRRDSTITDKATNGYYYLDENNNGVKDGTETTTRAYDENHRYEQEQITISGTDVNIKKVGSHDVPSSQSTSLVMYESTHNSYPTTSNPHQRLSNSVTLTLTAPTPAPSTGYVDITITPVTDTTLPPGHTEISGFSFRVYVMGPQNDTGSTGVASATDGVELVSDQSDRPINGHFTFTPSGSQPVYYSVQGSGRLYVSDPSDRTRRTSSTNNLFTSSLAPVYLDANGGSSKVIAYISGSLSSTATVLYIFNGGTLSARPKIEITGGNSQTGAPSGRLDDYFEVRVTDGRRRPVSGMPVRFTNATGSSAGTFIPVPGTKVYTAAPTSASIDAEVPEATATFPAAAATHHVQTDRNGVAKIYYQLSSNSGVHTVTADAYGVGTTANPLRATLSATASSSARARVANLEIVSGNPQSAAKNQQLSPLVVIARSTGGFRIPNVVIQFRTTTGILSPKAPTRQPGEGTAPGQIPTGTLNPPSGQQIYVVTGADGQASVDYYIGELTVARKVFAEVRHESRDSDYSFAIGEVTFNINGGGAREPTREPDSTTGSLDINVSATGATRSVTVTATSAAGTPTAIPVVLTGTALGSLQNVTSGTATEITVPTTPGSYTLTATASVAGYTPDTATITVAGPTSLGTISISLIGPLTNGVQTFSVTVVDTDGNRISGALRVTVSGSGFTTTSVPTANGSGAVDLTLPTTAGLYTLTASATDYTSGTTPVRIAGTGQQQQVAEEEEEEEEVVTVSEPDSVSIVGPSQREGTANTALDAALIVQVVDDDDDAVADARVIFRVRSGQGRLSERGNGRAIAVQTDSQGYGRVTYTPISASSTVEAEARGVTRRVTFTITASGGTATPTRDTTTPTTPGGTVSPVVHVGAAQRPPMLWVDGGAIYALVGASPERFAPSVENAVNIAVGGGKVYWTERTGESGGTINAANLNGSGVTELASIFATPIGIAVDTANSKLYWTNAAGRLQSANLDGSRITNELQNLEGVMDIALAGGNAYWTQGGNVRFVNLRGQKQIRNVSTGTDTAGSLAIAGGKVYWTERTGDSGGTVNAANLNGTGATQLASILAAPIGIAVDSSRSKLYWTNARGRVQSANLDGSKIQNVVGGLGSPGEIVLSNSIATPAATTTTTPKTTTADTSKYDVNNDGAVDNADASLVAAAMNTSNARYDVNGDGTVNFFDLLLVFDNRDPGAAGAPTLVGMQLSAVQIDVIEEQIDLLIATNDRSPTAIKTLIYLQQLIATARPEQTQLLANYPNPFNPETWIPYELATDTDVRITIYNTQGVVIRTLQLGQQSAGYYTDRERAAYWDGRNALGETVASGVYFYQLETDAKSLMRKMVILK